MGGNPNNTERKRGATNPTASPQGQPQIKPHSKAGICIGQSMEPISGICPVIKGSTIATGLLLGNKKESLAQFSFLMVIPPILGEALLDVLKVVKGEEAFGGIGTLPLVVGFLAAFLAGCLACKWMISIVKKGKLVYFGVYCIIAGLFAIALSQLMPAPAM